MKALRPLLILAALLFAVPAQAQMLGLPGGGDPGLKVFSAAGVGGSGTANRVAYWSAATTLTSDADFTFDGTNATLGSSSQLCFSTDTGLRRDAAGSVSFTNCSTGHATGLGLGTTTPKTGAGISFAADVALQVTGTGRATLIASGTTAGDLSLIDSNATANQRWVNIESGAAAFNIRRLLDADGSLGATYLSANLATDAVTLGSGTTTTVNIQSSDNKVSVLSAANAASLNLKTATTTVTCNSGTASCTASNLIPAGATVVSITARVTTILAGTGLTTWSLGDGVTADLWATGKALAAGTTVAATDHKSTWNIKFYNAANNVVLTAAAGQFDSGVVRLTVHYFDSTAPTS